MARVRLARAAAEDLERLIDVLALPLDTRARVRATLRPLAEFPRLGPELTGRWAGFRSILGPWPWLLCVHLVVPDGEAEHVVVVTIQDARSS